MPKVLTLEESMPMRINGIKYIVDKHLGRFYKYGGDGNDGIDCSQLALDFLRASGFNLSGDNTAAGLAKYFSNCVIDRKKAEIGDLYFFGKQVITHVCVCFKIWSKEKNYRLLIGANSGKSDTTTVNAAWMRDAYVKIVKDNYWDWNFNCAINPFLKFE